MLTGTIVNALAVLAGSVAGLLLTQLARRFSRFLPVGSASMGERLQTIIMQGVALCVIFIGISGSFKGSNTLIAILSMVIGAIIGELLDLGLPVFTELNLVDDGYDANIAKAKAKGVPLFLSSTMLYRRETQ